MFHSKLPKFLNRRFLTKQSDGLKKLSPAYNLTSGKSCAFLLLSVNTSSSLMVMEYRYSSPYFNTCLMTTVLYSPSFNSAVSKFRFPFPLMANEMCSLYELGRNLIIGTRFPGLQQLPPSVIRVIELQPVTFLLGLISTLKMNSFFTTGTSASLLSLVGLNSKGINNFKKVQFFK